MVFIYWFYFLFPRRPRIIAVEPERMMELMAFLAALLAMVLPSVVLPPVTAFTILVLSALATEDAALVAAC